MRIAKSLLQPAASRPNAAATPAADPTLLRMHALVKEGRPEAAIKIAIASLREGQGAPLLHLAKHCAKNGKPLLALDLLGLVGTIRPDLLGSLAQEPGFAALRDDPRFLQMTGGL